LKMYSVNKYNIKMKREMIGTWIAVMVLALAAPAEGNAQSFLKKMKEKANKAINKVTEEVAGKKVAEEEQAEADEEQPKGKPMPADFIPKLRQSGLVWDSEVTPSRARTVEELLAELPALPSAEQLANPTDAERRAFFDRLYAIEMRVDELDSLFSCSPEEMKAARQKEYERMTGLTGLTVEEMERLEDPSVTEAEKQRLEEKMANHILGGQSKEDLAAQMSAKAKSKEARMKELQAEMEAMGDIEKKAKNGTLTPAEQKRLQEISAEMQAINKDMMSGMGNVMNLQKQAEAMMGDMQGKQARLEGMLKQYADRAAALRKGDEGVVEDCREIGAAQEKKLREIYRQVFEANSADSVHALYDRADELVTNYRTRAAKIWLKSLTTRLANTKKLAPEAEKLYAEMAEAGIIPKCATRRASLNVVKDCIDVLRDAYDDFPEPEVLPFQMEAFAFLDKGDRILHAESGFAGGFGGGTGAGDLVEAFCKNSKVLVYNDETESYVLVANGKRTTLTGDGPFDYYRYIPDKEMGYGEIPLRKGGRKAVFGKWRSLTLHDGTRVEPLAMRRYADRLEFIIREPDNKFYKCTYKL